MWISNHDTAEVLIKTARKRAERLARRGQHSGTGFNGYEAAHESMTNGGKTWKCDLLLHVKWRLDANIGFGS